MDRSLWLLLRLRAFATLRRVGRSARSLKGLLLTIISAFVFGSMFLPMLFAPRIQTQFQHDAIRRFGPLALFLYCVLNVVLAPADRTIYYSPAEISFLFCGPYRPRQLLLYKITGGLVSAVITAFFLTIAFRGHATRWVSAYLAILLALAMMYLFALTVGLVINTVGKLAVTRARQALFFAILLALAVPLAPLANRAASIPPLELINRVVDSPGVNLLVAPLRPFVNTFLAGRVWPDLVGWSLLALAVDVGLLLVVLGLNAQFLEASAASSAKLYARLQQHRRGQKSVVPPKARIELPALPWLGGAGPNLWRQLTTASRTPGQAVAVVLVSVAPVAAILLATASRTDDAGVAGVIALAVVLVIGLFTPTMIAYDFRSDVGRMEDLKTLPIRPTRLVVGQLLTPILILCVAEWLVVVLIGLFTKTDRTWIVAALFLVAPLNLLLVAIENLYCLWFPVPARALNSFDVQAVARQLLLFMAKVLTLAVVGGAAGGLGAGVYYLGGHSMNAALAAVWIVLTLVGLALIPLVALAFDQLDVTEAMPE